MRTSPAHRARAGAHGFTLIELLVVVSLLAMLLLAAAPLASDWVHGAQTRESRGKLEQAYGVAKALAMRNPCGIRDSGAEAAQMKVAVEGSRATVSVSLPGDSSSCGFLGSHANPQWTAQLPPGVSVSIASATATQDAPLMLSLGNRGVSLTPTDFVLKKGSHNDESDSLH